MIVFDTEKVLLLQQLVVEETGGIFGVRDMGLLESAVNGIYQTFGGQDLYPSKEEKGAHLGYSLIKDHAFIDGNKRTGILVMLSFLAINGVKLKYTDEELIKIGYSLADDKMTYEALLSWVNNHKINTCYLSQEKC